MKKETIRFFIEGKKIPNILPITVILATSEFILTGSSDFTIKVWSKKDFIKKTDFLKEPIMTLVGHTGDITSMVLVSDTEIISSSSDGLIIRWNLLTGESNLILSGNSGRINCILNLNEKLLISGSDDSTIKIWDIQTGQCINTLELNSLKVINLFKRKDNRILFGSLNGVIGTWDPSTNIIVYLKGQTKSISAIKFINDDEILVVATKDKTITLWDMNTGEKIRTLSGHKHIVKDLVLLNKNKLLCSEKDGTIIVWDLITFNIVFTKKYFTMLTNFEMIDQNKYAICTESGKVAILETDNFTMITRIDCTIDAITCLENWDGNHVVVGYADGSVRIWSKRERKITKTFKNLYENKVHSVFKFNSNLLITTSSIKGKIDVWNIDTGKLVNSLDKYSGRIRNIVKVSKSEIVFSCNEKVIVWNVINGLLDNIIYSHPSSILGIISTINNFMISLSYDGHLAIYDLANKSPKITSKIIFDKNQYINNIVYLGKNKFGVFLKKPDAIEIMEFSEMDESIKKYSRINLKGLLRMSSFGDDKFVIGSQNGEISIVNTESVQTTTTDLIKLSSPIYKLVTSGRTEIIFVDRLGNFGIINTGKLTEIKINRLKLKIPIKTLLLGNSGSGKTTFAYWLEHGVFNEEIRSTDGMRFTNIRLESSLEVRPSVQGEVEFNIWDFGGQPEYQLSHQQNYDGSKLVFLIVDLSQPKVSDISNYFWIDRIAYHFNKGITSEDLKVIFIGTKAEKNDINLNRLKNLGNKLNKIVPNVSLDYQIVDTKKCTQIEHGSFKDKLRTYVMTDYKLDNIESFPDESFIIMERILELSKTNGYIYSDEVINNRLGSMSRDISNEINFLQKTGRIELIEDIFDNFYLNNEQEEDNESDYGIHYLNRIILLRPYWKDIVAKSILVAAQQNTNVIGSIRQEHLYGLCLKVEFDKLHVRNEEVLDLTLFEEARQDKRFLKIFVQQILSNFLTHNIMYQKLGMFVFPSRFDSKKSSFYNEEDKFKKVNHFKLTSKENLEESIAVIVTCIFYSNEYKIISHQFDSIKVVDKNNDMYLIRFHRQDDKIDSEVQYSVKISVSADLNAKNEKELITLIQTIINNRLIPEFKCHRFEIYDSSYLIGNITIESNEELLKGIDSTIKNCIEEKYSSENRNLLVNPLEISVVEAKDKNASLNKEKAKHIIDKIEQKIVKERKNIFKSLEEYFKTNSVRGERSCINILHLSDLHFSKNTDEKNEGYLLTEDLKCIDGLNTLRDIDYIVISGDIADRSEPIEYQKACAFLDRLALQCHISAEQIIIVPGNHDYSRSITHKAYEVEYDGNFDSKKDYKINDKLYLKRKQKAWERRFKYFSEFLYEYVYNVSFNPNASKQLKLIKSDSNEPLKLVFLGFNTAAEIDHFNPNKVIYDSQSLLHASQRVGSDYIKIGVGHHPLSFENGIHFINALQNEEFGLYLHGHVHREIIVSSSNPQNKNPEMAAVGAGTFGADPQHVWPGIPHRYNMIKISNNKDEGIVLEVRTRQRNDSLSHWFPANIYYNKMLKSMTDVWIHKIR